MLILTGDVGGTSTRLALVSATDEGFRIEHEARYASGEHSGLEPIAVAFLREHTEKRPEVAAFGVAGPVINGACETTNLPWRLSASSLAVTLDLPRVHLLNDLEALAWGIDTLRDGDRVELQAGAPVASGNRAVIAAGTGLGQAGLTFDGALHRPFACEGGHTDFAPHTARDDALLSALRARHGHVSWERIVSGPGLVTLFRHTLERHAAEPPSWLDAPGQDPAAAISRLALAGEDPCCVEALDWFVELYGREAGNLALKLNASGGLFIGGGIAPRILPALRGGRFIEAFRDKGRMRPLLENMPVSVIVAPGVALTGLARYAMLAAT